MNNHSPVVHAEGVWKWRSAAAVLADVNLRVDPGEVVCLIGPSGAGKTTLLRCLDLLLLIDAGKLYALGRPLVSAERRSDGAVERAVHVRPEEHRRRIGLVFQEFNLWSDRSVLANLIEGPVYGKGVKRDAAEDLARRLLADVGLAGFEARRPGRLSGGQRQRVAIARALAMEPQLLLLDEITSALDPELVGDVLDLLRRLADAGRTMIVVTHHIEFARQVADRVIMMDGGRVIEIGSAEAVLDAPTQPRTQDFLSRLARLR